MLVSLFSAEIGKSEVEEVKNIYLAVVVAQLVERSLPTPEVRGSIPIGDINIDQYSTNCNLEKTKIKKKRPGKAHLFFLFKEYLLFLI